MIFVRKITVIILAFFSLCANAHTASFPIREYTDTSKLKRHEGTVKWDIAMYGLGATDGVMPFWSTANKHGLIPSQLWIIRGNGNTLSGDDTGNKPFMTSGIMTAGVDIAYKTGRDTEISAGLSFGGSGSPSGWQGISDKLYFGFRWKKLHLDLGMKDRPADFNGLSQSGGNIVYSGNAKNMPGYHFHTDFIYIPHTRKILAFKLNFADYMLTDNRFVRNALLHNESLYAKIRLHPQVFLTLGLEIWSQWSGISPLYGHQPSSFKDYIRILIGYSGGIGASKSDQINALGNHLGRELIRFDWEADDFRLTFQHDIPFDDGSGMGFQNFPDGVNTLNLSFRDRNKWISDILLEFTYTKWQSGTRHDRPPFPDELEQNPDKLFYVIGGCDNYFNNGEYLSGWTYNGRTIGLPLFTTTPVNEDGHTYGVCNNRIIAYHLGLNGMAAGKIPYKFMFTYSRNFGKYHQSLNIFNTVPEQFSVALEGEWPGLYRKHGRASSLPVSVGIGLYADFGNLLHDSFGLTVRLSYNDRKFFRR